MFPSFFVTAINILSMLWLLYLIIMQAGVELPTPQLTWIMLVPTIAAEFVIIVFVYALKASGDKSSAFLLPYSITLFVGWNLLFKEYLRDDASKTLTLVSRLVGGISLAFLIALLFI
jgi:hypothetical protein